MSGNPLSIYVATPCYGGQAFTNYVISILALQRDCAAREIGLHIELRSGDALISRARAIMAAQFLARPSYTHLMFIDADIGFEPEQVLRLLQSGHDVVGGVYPAKRIDWARAKRAWEEGREDIAAASQPYVVRFLPNPTHSIDVDDQGFGEVAYVGTGFMMIRREALERLVAEHSALRALHADAGDRTLEAAMVFDPMIEPETNQYLSEDYAFCRRWRDLGGKIHADVRGRFSHVGHTTFTGGLIDVQR